MAGYWSSSALPAVLADLLLTRPGTEGHQPTSYEVFVAAAPGERSARVTCACAAIVEVDWDAATQTYRELLRAAWLQHAGD